MTDQEIMLEAADETQSESVEDENEISADVVNLSQTVAGTVKAELVRINQGGAEKIIAGEVEFKQGGANRIEAQTVKFSDGGAAVIQAANIDFKDGGAGLVRAEQVSLTDAGAVVLISQGVSMENGAQAGVIVTRQVNAEKVQTKVLLAGNVQGDVETMVDTRQALLAGLSAGFVVGTLLLIGQLFSRRK
jgi:hypothetical protein